MLEGKTNKQRHLVFFPRVACFVFPTPLPGSVFHGEKTFFHFFHKRAFGTSSVSELVVSCELAKLGSCCRCCCQCCCNPWSSPSLPLSPPLSRTHAHHEVCDNGFKDLNIWGADTHALRRQGERERVREREGRNALRALVGATVTILS